MFLKQPLQYLVEIYVNLNQNQATGIYTETISYSVYIISI
jgi:hypothetical protein